MPTTDCGIIILAAGNSSRLGVPKQLLMYKNKTLLQHSIDEAIASELGEVIVVTGSNYDSIVSSLPGNTVRYIYNEHWQQGMAGSMQVGLAALLASQPSLSSVIIMLCDQPFVSSILLQEITTKKRVSSKGIVACEYKETLGVPVSFFRRYFDALFSLQGAEGAKKLIMKYANDVAVVPFPEGAIDIDTAEDYKQLMK